MRNSHNNQINDLNSFCTRIRQQIFDFEMHSFKTKAKITKNHKLLKDSLNELEYYRKTSLYGFNTFFGILGMLSYHSVFIYMNRHMLSELSFMKCRNHIMGSLVVGTVTGYMIGYTFAKNLRTYRTYKNVKHELDEMYKNFEYYYILNKEQQFDD
jgi:hypothetical protein